jgi:hypothetical protein
MNKYLIIAGLLLSFGNAFAGIPDAFNERFNFVKKDGKLIEIRDRSMGLGFSIAPYIKFIKETLKSEQALMKSKSDYYGDVEELLNDDAFALDEKSNQNVKIVMDSLKALENLDIDKIFSNPKFNTFISNFEGKLKFELSKLNPSVLANTQDATFFYKRKVTYQVVTWGLALAKKIFSSVPVLNTASYVLVKVEKLIREKRLFHQNLLMHYFENHESELGLSKEDVDLAYSSIYESRISWFAFWESNAAKANWTKYGVNKFYSNVRVANANLRANGTRYSTRGKRMNFAFQTVKENDENVIINLFDRQSMFNAKPAVAFYIDNPKKMVRKRIIMQLAGLGISFLPIPSFVKNIGDRYIKSTYEKQKLTEGALYGYFEATSNTARMNEVLMQYQNPFDVNIQL